MKHTWTALVLSLMVGFCLISCGTETSEEIVPINAAWLEDNLQCVTLELYYIDPDVLTRAPWNITDLIRSCNIHITVRGGEIQKHKDLLCQMFDTPIVPIDNEDGYLNARIYLALYNEEDEAVFEVAMWGKEDVIFVNGIPCTANSVFYDVIMEFLPEDASTELRNYIGRQGDG